jgi:uncharacterized protein
MTYLNSAPFIDRPRNPERIAAWILAGIATAEGLWVVINWFIAGNRFWRYLGFAEGQAGNSIGWISAAIVTGLFVWQSLRLPSVRANLFRPSYLKALGVAVAVSAGILEEVVFRKLLMDYVRDHGLAEVAQILVSGLAFGAAHGIWGLFGRSVRAALGATVATGILGAALGVVYVVSGRSLAPCIAAHFAINALIEPGLVLAATRGEMGRRRG